MIFSQRNLLKLIHLGYISSLYPKYKRFINSAINLEETQHFKLFDLLKSNSSTKFAEKYNFKKVNSVSDYQSKVPISDYDSISPWIDKIKMGEKGILTSETVLMMEKTSGSTSANKLIPYTKSLLEEFSSATGPWLYDIFSTMRSLIGTTSYWSISSSSSLKEVTEGGVPVGFEDDTAYFGPMARWALNKMMAVPGTVSSINDKNTWENDTIRYLLSAGDLGIISVWSPTFLILFMRRIQKDLERFLPELPKSRSDYLYNTIKNAKNRLNGEAIWPNLQLISCWSEGHSINYIKELRTWFPNIYIQGKGLLATEGVITFPLIKEQASVLATNSHFYEFIDLQHPDKRPILAHELKEGYEYSPLISTSGGLYRYHLKDIVKCTGFFTKAPLLKFINKLDNVSDICGEKISEKEVELAIKAASEKMTLVYKFILLAPVIDDPAYYCLFVETESSEKEVQFFACFIDNYLKQNYHYKYCRKIGQLDNIKGKKN